MFRLIRNVKLNIIQEEILISQNCILLYEDIWFKFCSFKLSGLQKADLFYIFFLLKNNLNLSRYNNLNFICSI